MIVKRKQLITYSILLAIVSINPVLLFKVIPISGNILFILILLCLTIYVKNLRFFTNTDILFVFPLLTVIFLTVQNTLIWHDIIILQDTIQILLIILLVKIIIANNIEFDLANKINGLISFFVITTLIISFFMWIGVLSQTHTVQLSNNTLKSFYGIYNWSEVIIPRFQIARTAGPFDEPGQFVFVLWHCIILNEITTKNIKFRNLMVIGGIFTFSLAHYICLIMFIVWEVFGKGSILKKSLYVTSIYIFVFALYKSNQVVARVIDYAFLGRVNVNSGAANVASNRLKYTSDVWSMMNEKPFYGVGRSGVEVVAANFVDILYTYGLISGLLLAFPVLLLSYLLLSRGRVALSLIILVLYAQRPSFFQVINMSLVFFMLHIILYRDTVRQKCRDLI